MRRDEQMQKKNYQKELDKKIEQIVSEKKVPRLFLHSCCAPCSSYVLEYLSEYFEITVFYYNPNIFPEAEFEKRIHEQEKLIRELPAKHTIHFQAGNYDSEKFYEMAKGLEMIPEGGERCFRCYELRLREAARFAKEGRYDYFTTTLSISPLKNAQKLNEIGEWLAGEYGVAYLVSDFKKRNGYVKDLRTLPPGLLWLYLFQKSERTGKETSGGRGKFCEKLRGELYRIRHSMVH